MGRFRTCLVVCLYSSGFAQSDTELDSLQHLLVKPASTEKIKIEIYIAIANHYLLKEPQLVVNYSDSAEQIVGKSTEFGDYLPKLNLLKGQAFNRQSLHLEAQFYLDKEHSIT